MQYVFVIDTNKQPLAPTHPARVHRLLTQGKAAVFRRYPFTIILKRAVEPEEYPPLRLKLDPGSKTTGLAILNETSGEVIFAAEVQHRGQDIRASLDGRRASRRSRRQRHTRYRQPRFDNRRNKGEGWIPPSQASRVCNIVTWVKRLKRVCPLTALSQELVRFDMQLMEHPEISGVQYQQGTLAGYEVREYLLEKWGRQCVYCSATNVPLSIEHIHPRVHGGSDRISNLTLACQSCNQKKGAQDVRAFLKHKPDLLQKILSQAKTPLKDAAAVNVTRWALYRRLQALGMPVECGTGGRTKYNRTLRGLPKTHRSDAACVGASTPDVLHVQGVVPLLIKATGRGSRQMCRMDKFGFPRTGPKQAKSIKGFQTGDMVKAVVTAGTKRGTYVGRVAVRATGSFNITTKHGTVQGIGYRVCSVLHRGDGYSYGHGRPLRPSPKQGTPASSPCLKEQGVPQAEV